MTARQNEKEWAQNRSLWYAPLSFLQKLVVTVSAAIAAFLQYIGPGNICMLTAKYQTRF